MNTLRIKRSIWTINGAHELCLEKSRARMSSFGPPVPTPVQIKYNMFK